jgi:hypothetical protein
MLDEVDEATMYNSFSLTEGSKGARYSGSISS